KAGVSQRGDRGLESLVRGIDAEHGCASCRHSSHLPLTSNVHLMYQARICLKIGHFDIRRRNIPRKHRMHMPESGIAIAEFCYRRTMRYHALVTDYDFTIAEHSVVSDQT